MKHVSMQQTNGEYIKIDPASIYKMDDKGEYTEIYTKIKSNGDTTSYKLKGDANKVLVELGLKDDRPTSRKVYNKSLRDMILRRVLGSEKNVGDALEELNRFTNYNNLRFENYFVKYIFPTFFRKVWGRITGSTDLWNTEEYKLIQSVRKRVSDSKSALASAKSDIEKLKSGVLRAEGY